MKNHFFLGKLYQQLFFALHSRYTGDTQNRVGFDLDNSLTRWKTTIFKILKNLHFAEIRKIPYQKPFFSLASYTNNFWLYTVITLVIPNTEFGLIWATPWPDEKQLFLKFSKIRNSRNS